MRGLAVRPADPTGAVRADIQALRALAVGAVVANHLRPDLVPGGYTGVDIFFVISGFLITSHLVREVDRTGRIALAGFWARRARRLLPASLLVIAASAIATYLWVPQSLWQQFFRDFGASTFYVLNWALAADSVDYFAAENRASPVQHYWSLSAEEQFYLVWPLLILGGLLIARAVRRANRWAVIAAVLVVLTIASLATSVVLTATDPAPAYFVTTTRAWEFGIGGLVAAALAAAPRLRDARLPILRPVAAWAGHLALLAVLWTFDDATPFPGWLALVPVLACALVIWAGSGPVLRGMPDPLLRLRPVQWLGDISYSVYLWHWPLIVLAPFALGVDGLSTPHLLLVLVATLALAWATKVLVEDPVRRAPALVRRRPLVTFAAVVASMSLVAGVAGGTWLYIEKRTDDSATQATILAAEDPDCFGAAAMTQDPGTCDEPDSVADIVPDRTVGVGDAAIDSELGCRANSGDTEVPVCTLAEGEGMRVALVGDSHAEHWAPALTVLAEENGWTLDTYLKGGCAFSTVLRADDAEVSEGTCATWNDDVVARLADGGYDLIVTSQATGREYAGAPGESSAEAAARGFAERWRQARESTGATVVAIRDTPAMPFNVPECVSGLDAPATELGECTARDAEALLEDPQAAGAKAADVPFLDLTEYFCRDGECPSVIGSVIVYRDEAHLGGTYSRSLAPFLGAELDAVLAG